MLDTVVELRGLRPDRPVNVTFVPPAEVARLHESNRTANGRAADSRYDGMLAGLDLLPPSGKREGLTSRAKLRTAMMESFYDYATDRVISPKVVPASESRANALEALLAHELFHALQHQTFKWPELTESDELLAWRSLVEGDASVVQAVYDAKKQGVSASRQLAWLRYAIDAPLEPPARVEQREAWSQAPAVLQTTQRFPYREGAAFVVDLHRAGGFELVDRAYERRPRSTEQILHPQRYLDGDVPHTVGKLMPPSGWTLASTDVLGELGVRMFLTSCLGKERAAEAAEGWGGDRVFTLTRGDQMMLAWATSWDTDEDARQFEAALEGLSECLQNNDADGRSIGTGYAVRRQGVRVAFARGGEPRDRDPLLPLMVALPEAPPPRVAVADVRIPALAPPPESRPPTVKSGSFQSDFMGIRGRIPKGFKVEPRKKDAELRIKSDWGQATLKYDRRVVSRKRASKLLDKAEAELASFVAEKQLQLLRVGEDELDTQLGPAFERRWMVRRLNYFHGTVLVPICDGKGALRIEFVHAFRERASAFEHWIESFERVDAKARPPICQLLDPR